MKQGKKVSNLCSVDIIDLLISCCILTLQLPQLSQPNNSLFNAINIDDRKKKSLKSEEL